MEHGDAVAEASLEAPDRLGGQGDLGNQNDGSAADLQGVADSREIDLGLPAAGDPVEERGLALAPIYRLVDGGDSGALVARLPDGRRAAPTPWLAGLRSTGIEVTRARPFSTS